MPWTKLGSIACHLKNRIAEVCGLVADLAGSLKACVDMTVDRVGRETAPVYDKDECPGTFANELRANCHKMVEMAEYMSCCSTLQGGTTKFKVESQPGDADKSNIVINFARLHHKFQGEPFDFTCRCELANVAILAKFKQNSEVFVEQFGKAIYQEHAMSFMSTETPTGLAKSTCAAHDLSSLIELGGIAKHSQPNIAAGFTPA